MKVIDLLNKIANGEEIPLKIKVKGYEYRQSNGQFWCDETEMYLIDNCTSIYHLNDEVEIIEEPQEHKIPEKMNFVYKNEDDMQNANNERFKYYINAILDYLEEENNGRNI